MADIVMTDEITEEAMTKHAITSMPCSSPVFNFPKEESHNFTAADLIAILKVYGGGPRKKMSAKPPRASSMTKQACVAEALNRICPDPTHKRVIFRSWPRSPTGKYILPENSLPGKQTPNGLQLWGATMFDFYRVRRIPNLPNLSTITTGSKLLRWMKANNELDWAKDEISWAENEEDPKIIEPYPLRDFIEEQENAIRQGKVGISMPDTDIVDKGKSRASIFDRSNHPSPWPLVPFSYPTDRLQTLIPLHHLPRKIIVHDPWDLLTVEEYYDEEQDADEEQDTDEEQYINEEQDTDEKQKEEKKEEEEKKDWTKMKDHTHIYNLQLSPAGRARFDEESARAAQRINERREQTTLAKDNESMLDNDNVEKLQGYLIRPPVDTPGPIPPPIYVLHDPPPRPPAPQPDRDEEGLGYGPIGEAHLYISPEHRIGKGHHSIVYHGEWEIPRSAMFPPTSTDPVLCDACVEEDIDRILIEEDGPNGERMESRWREKRSLVEFVDVTKRSSVEFSVLREDAEDERPVNVLVDPGELKYRVEFEGPVRPIRTTIGWQDPLHPTCKHLSPPPIVPPTVKVRVAAKLSMEHDDHLQAEAENYQMFDRHMFEHWSGLTVLPPMHDPVPVGALVPQFYGYYIPEVTPSEGYLSPVLLMEDCGAPVEIEDLTTDEKNEALSLIHRFSAADWIHGSVYARNILSQYGPLDVSSTKRLRSKEDRTLSFRLIDFGRSYKYQEDKRREWQDDRLYQQHENEQLFGAGFWSM